MPQRIYEEVKVRVDDSGISGGSACMRKRKSLTQALYREKKKMKGEAAGVQPKTASDIMENLDMKYQTTSTSM